MIILAILAIVLFAVAVAMGFSALIEPRLRRSEYLGQIGAYGYASSAEAVPNRPRQTRKTVDALATSLGDLVAKRVLAIREEEIQRELVSAGLFRIGARRFLGYRVLLAIALPVALVWLFGFLGTSLAGLLFLAVLGFLIGWVGPSFYVHRRARTRLREVDEALPNLIDLLVVTLEAGVAFSAALRLASERLRGPLGEEVRLTIQEQSLGLATLDSLENWLRRCDTPAVRSFVRAMVQGDRLGVSIGQILRNQSIEMRKRQRALVEERAQKAPIKLLFPLVFLIFPAMFVIVLGPAMLTITKALHAA